MLLTGTLFINFLFVLCKFLVPKLFWIVGTGAEWPIRRAEDVRATLTATSTVTRTTTATRSIRPGPAAQPPAPPVPATAPTDRPLWLRLNATARITRAATRTLHPGPGARAARPGPVLVTWRRPYTRRLLRSWPDSNQLLRFLTIRNDRRPTIIQDLRKSIQVELIGSCCESCSRKCLNFEKSPKISDGSDLNGTLGNDFGTFELSSEAKIVILLLWNCWIFNCFLDDLEHLTDVNVNFENSPKFVSGSHVGDNLAVNRGTFDLSMKCKFVFMERSQCRLSIFEQLDFDARENVWNSRIEKFAKNRPWLRREPFSAPWERSVSPIQRHLNRRLNLITLKVMNFWKSRLLEMIVRTKMVHVEHKVN